MDPTTEPTAGTRPGEVTLAVRLIWISITIGLVISGNHWRNAYSGNHQSYRDRNPN